MTKEILIGFDIRKHFEILSLYGSKNVGTIEKMRKCQKGESICFVLFNMMEVCLGPCPAGS